MIDKLVNFFNELPDYVQVFIIVSAIVLFWEVII
jgi:hypothetical protein